MLAAALLLGACAPWPGGEHTPAGAPGAAAGWARDARERDFQREWIGRTRDELTQTMGKPNLVMGVPGHRWPQVVILVYRQRDPQGGCIDAFVVQQLATEVVSNYFCR